MPSAGRWAALFAGELRRLRAASDFLDGQKVTKEPLGGGRNRRFGKASPPPCRPPPRTPITGDAYLLDFAVFPARKI